MGDGAGSGRHERLLPTVPPILSADLLPAVPSGMLSAAVQSAAVLLVRTGLLPDSDIGAGAGPAMAAEL